jgi:hypothetical protein
MIEEYIVFVSAIVSTQFLLFDICFKNVSFPCLLDYLICSFSISTIIVTF